MRALFAIAMLAACSGPRTAFECTTNASCRNGGMTGTCETTGFCSFPDSTCPMGSRYGTAAGGGLAGECVGATPGSDAGSGSDGSGTNPDAEMIIDPHTLGTWTTTAAMPNGRYTFAYAQDASNVYVIGGILGSTGKSDVWFATGNPAAILPAAAVSTWTQTTALPAARWTFAGAYDAGYLYVFAGKLGTGSLGDSIDVLSAAVNGNGTIGAWTATTSLPQTMKCEASASSGQDVYLIGGKHSGNAQSLVLHARMSGGTMSAWDVAATLDVTLFDSAAVVVNGYLYVIGGCGGGSNACSPVLDIVEFAKINPADGSLGAFAHTAALPTARSHHNAAVSGHGDIYVLGGTYGADLTTADTPDVIAAHPSSDGTIAAWHPMTALPIPRRRGSAAVIGNYLVLFHAETQVVQIQ
jgi:hypothetical protein